MTIVRTLLSLVQQASLTSLLRGRRSRNKVSVGEPAEGSFVDNPDEYVNSTPSCEKSAVPAQVEKRSDEFLESINEDERSKMRKAERYADDRDVCAILIQEVGQCCLVLVAGYRTM